MTDPQPEYVWAYPDEKSGRSRMWLMIALGTVAVIAAVAIFLAFVRPWEHGDPEPVSTASTSPSPSTTASVSPSPTASATPSATPTPTPTETPAPTTPPTSAPTAPPPPADPALPVFRGKVQPLLDDAVTGLSYAADASGEEGIQIADQLRDDAGRLSDMVAPSSIASAWRSHAQEYGRALESLRAAFAQGGSTSSQLSAARSALRALSDVVAG
jgi:cytoskeletal protein RodZ